MATQEKKKSYTVVWVLLVILIFFIVGFVIVYFVRRNKEQNAPRPSVVQCTSDANCAADGNVCRLVGDPPKGLCLPKCTNKDGGCPTGWTCGTDGKCVAPASK